MIGLAPWFLTELSHGDSFANMLHEIAALSDEKVAGLAAFICAVSADAVLAFRYISRGRRYGSLHDRALANSTDRLSRSPDINAGQVANHLFLAGERSLGQADRPDFDEGNDGAGLWAGFVFSVIVITATIAWSIQNLVSPPRHALFGTTIGGVMLGCAITLAGVVFGAFGLMLARLNASNETLEQIEVSRRRLKAAQSRLEIIGQLRAKGTGLQ